MNAMLKTYPLRACTGALLVLFLLGTAAPAAAQRSRTDPDTIRVPGNRVVIEFDADGGLIVDGRRVERTGEGYVLHVSPGDDAVVLRTGPSPFRFGGAWAPSPGRTFRFHHSDDPADAFVFDLPARHLEHAFAPLRDDVAFMGERMREEMEVAGLEQEAHRLAREARRAEGAERTRLEQELRSKLGDIFDRKMALRREHVDRLERELREARDHFEARRQARGDMIDRRLRALLGEDDALEW